MEDQEIREALGRHWSVPDDIDGGHEIYHEDVVLEFPQGNERLVGLKNVRAMREAYSAAVTLDIKRMRGRDDLWVTEVMLTYDGERPAHAVNIMEFRDGKVARETIYFGEPWEAPAWRARWVEPMVKAAAPA